MEVRMYNYRDFKIPYDRGIEIDQEVDAEIKKKQHTEIGGLSKISELLRVWKWLGFNFILEYISGSILLFVVGYHQTVTVSTKETKDDFGRVYIGELTDEDFAKYKSILARATTTYTDEHWAGTGLTLTRSVDYRNPLYKNID